MLVIAVLVLALAVVPAAYAAKTLSKVFPDTVNHWFKDEISQVSDAGLMQGRTDGKFYPQDNVTRGESAAVFARTMDWTESKVEERALMTPEQMSRGCTSCHAQVAPDGRYLLAWEAENANPGAHPFAPTDDIPLYDDPANTGAVACMDCHRSNAAGTAVGALHSMRDIVHPVHMNSGVFLGEFNGNCFNCHNVSFDGTFQVLPEAIEASENGVPTEVPIPTATDPLDPPNG
jgi:hypothetical protein